MKKIIKLFLIFILFFSIIFHSFGEDYSGMDLDKNKVINKNNYKIIQDVLDNLFFKEKYFYFPISLTKKDNFHTGFYFGNLNYINNDFLKKNIASINKLLNKNNVFIITTEKLFKNIDENGIYIVKIINKKDDYLLFDYVFIKNNSLKEIKKYFSKKLKIYKDRIISNSLDTLILVLKKDNPMDNFNLTLNNIGENEVGFFQNYFLNGDKNKKLIYEKVKEIQEEFGYSLDKINGIIDDTLLKKIYMNYYSKNILDLDLERKKRLEIYDEMEKYNDNNKNARVKDLDVFKKMTFFGDLSGGNISGTYIDSSLKGKVEDNLGEEKNVIEVKNIDGKAALFFYKNGELLISTFVSPGDLKSKTPEFSTKGKRSPDKYHSSSLFPKTINPVTGRVGGDIMAYSIHIDGPYFFHGSDGIINGKPSSHGCIRVPLYYINELYKQIDEIGFQNIFIKIENLY